MKEFLNALRPGGPWTLTAFREQEDIKPTAVLRSAEKVEAFVKHWQEQRFNIYIQANTTREDLTSKARKSDLTSCDRLQVDIDKNAAGFRLTPQEMEEKRAELQARKYPPHIINYTGNGVQAIWLVAGCGSVEDAGRANDFILDEHNGDRGTWSPVHLMRMPGTKNFPTKKKREQGLTEVRDARVAYIADNLKPYDFSVFPLAEARAGGLNEAIQNIGPADLMTLAEIKDRWPLPEHVERIIIHGEDPEDKRDGWTRSEWVWRCTTDMIKAGVPLSVVKGVLLNTDFRISEKTYDQGGRTAEDYAEREVCRAKAHVDIHYYGGIDDVAIDEKWLVEGGGEEPEKETAAPIGQKNFQLYRPSELEGHKPPQWIIEDMIQADSVNMIFGQSGHGKTYFGLHLALCTGTGIPVGWRKVNRTRVLYIIAEGLHDFSPRIQAWLKYHGKSYADLDDYFRIITHSVLIDQPLPKTTDDPPNDGIRLMQKIKAHGPFGLLCVDTLNRNMAGDENATKDMTAYLAGVDWLKRKGGGMAQMHFHHMPKSGGTPRGSNAFEGGCDGVFRVTMKKTHVEVYAHKMRATEGGWREDWEKVQVEYAPGEKTKIVLKPAPVSATSEGEPEKASKTDALLHAIWSDPKRTNAQLAEVVGTSDNYVKAMKNRLIKEGLLAQGNIVTPKGEEWLKVLADKGISAESGM